MSLQHAFPVAYHFSQEIAIPATPDNVASGEFFRQLHSLAVSRSAAQSLVIPVHPPLGIDDRHPWMRVPPAQMEEFSRSPLVCVQKLVFYFQTPSAVSLIFDILSFMPSLRTLEVVSLADEDTCSDMPDFEHPTAPLLYLEHLNYGSGLGLQTLMTRVVSPAAGMLKSSELFWGQIPKRVPQIPFLPRLRALITTGIFDDAARQLLRQCPALTQLQIFVSDHGQLDDLFKTLHHAGVRLRSLRIVRHMDDFDDNDARELCDSLALCKSLQKLFILTKDRYEASAVAILRTICYSRRIRVDFRSGR